MKSRLQKFLDAENISQSHFADRICVGRASVSHILAGRNNPSYDFIINIMKTFPNLSIEWLMKGEGRMYKNTTEESPINESQLFSFDDELSSVSASAEDDYISHEVPREKPITVQDEIIMPNITQTDTLAKAVQSSINQRKAVKILIFYDDNSFQELLTRP